MTVTVNMAMSVDGKIATAFDEPANLTSHFDRARMREHRARADAVLVGAQTLRACNPPLGILDSVLLAKRLAENRPEQPAAVVVTHSGRVEEASRFWQHEGRKLVVTSEAGRAHLRREGFFQKAEFITYAEAPFSMHFLVEELAKKGLRELLVEGGGELAWCFAEAGLVSRLHVTIAPLLLGGRTAPTPLGGAGFSIDDATALQLKHLEQQGDELYLTYVRKA